MAKSIEDLCDAICQGDTEQLTALIDAGLDVNQLDDDGNPPLLFAANVNSHVNLPLLLDAGADPNIRIREEYEEDGETILGSDDGATTLIRVAGSVDTQADLDAISMLVKAGADVNAQDTAGRTALMHAIERGMGSPDAVELLLNLGADPNLRDHDGVSPLMVARGRLDDPVVEENMEPICHMLELAGASKEGLDAVELVESADKGDVVRVRELIAAGADVNLADGAALQCAAGQGHADVVNELLQAGADPNLREPGYFTALIRAASCGHLEVLKALVAAGADPALEVRGMGSALDYARMEGHVEVAEYLQGLGVQERGFTEERGIASADVNEMAVLVKAPLDEVTPAFGRLRDAQFTTRNVTDKTVQSTDLCFIVYQLAGHDWTTIQYVHTDWQGDGLGEADAQGLSRLLRTEAINYGNSDTAGAIGYAYYRNGERIEQFEYYEDYSEYIEDEEVAAKAQPPDGAIVDEDGMVTYFRSEDRDVSAEEMDDPVEFVDQFLRSKEAFVPGWSELARCTWESGQEFSLSGQPPTAFVGADFVAVR